jgi:hypothetical protein
MRTPFTLAFLALAACDFGSDPDSRDLGGARTVRGEIVDYKTGMPVVGASLEVSGLADSVAPTITVTGSSFEIEGVLEQSAFQIRASATSYRPTFGPAVTVVDADVTDIRVPLVSVAYLESLVAAFDVMPPAGGILFGQLVRDDRPVPGVGTSAFMMPGGPYFLDAALAAVPGGQVTSSSGAVVFFDLAPGVTELLQPPAPPVALDMATSPIEAGSVTIAEIGVSDTVALPTNVSFATQVYPIFERRGCEPCHSANGEGKDLGGLTLGGGEMKVYNELMEGIRVNKASPLDSSVLTYPSRESPPDRHPNITFASSKDPDYLTILVWIQEGAKNN